MAGESDAAYGRAVLEERLNVLLHQLMTGQIRMGELELETLSDSTPRSGDKGHGKSMSDVFGR